MFSQIYIGTWQFLKYMFTALVLIEEGGYNATLWYAEIAWYLDSCMCVLAYIGLLSAGLVYSTLYFLVATWAVLDPMLRVPVYVVFWCPLSRVLSLSDICCCLYQNVLPALRLHTVAYQGWNSAWMRYFSSGFARWDWCRCFQATRISVCCRM